jgi:arylsulfatase A
VSPALMLPAGRPVYRLWVMKTATSENGKIKKDAPPAQLYDLEADVNQTKNLYNEYPEVVQEMKALLESYQPAESTLDK